MAVTCDIYIYTEWGPNATGELPYCGGAPPPPQSTICILEPSPSPPGCHKVGGSCKIETDCCPDNYCHSIYCDTEMGHCVKRPPPPFGRKNDWETKTYKYSTQEHVKEQIRAHKKAVAKHYFVRSIDPVTSGGAMHGVVGASQFG